MLLIRRTSDLEIEQATLILNRQKNSSYRVVVDPSIFRETYVNELVFLG